ncbi:MAG: family 10 glycosylhydrolase [Armatimonadetes bacterium]|nr:family 10 glycosylhydrolase [Armatimonadota bacterium]
MFVSSGAAANSKNNLVCKEKGLQGRLVWFDAEANMWQLSTRRGVADMVAKCKAANINTIIVDVKPLSGLVLYKSEFAPRLTIFEGKQYPRNYDLLQVVLEEGHKAGIAVHAAINVFSEGSQELAGGPAFKHPDWQCVHYDVDRFLSTDDGTNMKLTCTDGPYGGDQVCIYGKGARPSKNLPENTTYVRITREGDPIQYGTAAGKPKISTPEGGFLLVANGEAGAWLKKSAESRTRFHLDGKGVLKSVSELDNVHHAVFVNPLHPDVRAYELGVVKEICRRYAVDGLVLDRMRYPNIYADFSDITRKAFEGFMGQAVTNWPDDVFKRTPAPGDDVVRGPLFKQWIKFRAKVMRDFLAEVRETVKSVKPRAKLGIYVGSWYPMYYDVGVNWGSPNHSAKLDWWPDGYEETGYADLVDYMCTGCYYTHPTREDAKASNDEEWKSVEAAAEESVNAVNDATFVYGSLYLYQYKGRPDKFLAAMNQCLDKTQGCMLFDLVYLRDYKWWDTLKQAFPVPAQAPHAVPGLLGMAKGRIK